MATNAPAAAQAFQAGILAWILPGAGHFFLGQRGMAAIFFVAISVPFWTGIAVGGVKDQIDPRGNRWLFAAAIGIGGYTTACTLVRNTIPSAPPDSPSPYVSYFPESEVAQIYIAVAGLLNVMAILDAISRAQTGGLPVFHHERAARDAAERGS